jgi:DNA ligase (NAD+)
MQNYFPEFYFTHLLFTTLILLSNFLSMYNTSYTKELQQITTQLLKNIEALQPGNIEQLRDVLRFHEYRYYILNDPLIADAEYDKLFKKVEQFEATDPTIITADSPTQRVAKGLTKDFATVPHLVPMLSLDNSYNADDLFDFDRKARELSGLPLLEYCIEPKFDGASISLIYENDFLTRAATRGDGVMGDDITVNIKQIRSVPLSAKFSSYGVEQIEIRGEVLLTKVNFKKYNDQLAEQNLPPLANPRNAAAGSLRIKDSKEVKRRNLEAFLYHISYVVRDENNKNGAALQTHSGSLQMLWQLGFRSPQQEKKVCKGIQAVIDYCIEYEQKRDDLPYEIDGMVIKVNDIEVQEKLGQTTHHPRWAIAYKFKARQGTSKLLRVEFQVGRTGAVTPVAKIQPVAIGGVNVSSISLHNQEFIKEKDVMTGDTVLVERAGDVIPYIVKSMPELRTGSETPVIFPQVCPSCKAKLVKEETEAVWRCINNSCPAQVVERIIHFVSKDAMDIRSLGESNVRKFYELGFLKNIPAIYNLPFDEIKKMEGFGTKSIENLQKAIETSRHNPLHRLITALGIRYVGETTAKTIANSVQNLLQLQNYTPEQLQTLEDVGIKVAESVHQYFSNADNINMLEELAAAGVSLQNNKKQQVTKNSLHGQTFLFTGTLAKLKRSDAEALVETHGGKLLSGVSSKLNYLVTGEDAGSKLEKAKKINSVSIISEDEFLQLLKDNE